MNSNVSDESIFFGFHPIDDEWTVHVVSQSDPSSYALEEPTDAQSEDMHDLSTVFHFNVIDTSASADTAMDEEDCAEIIACTPQKSSPTTEHEVCSICWSPCALDMMASVDEETQGSAIATPERIPDAKNDESKSLTGRKKKALRTKCGHTFHENCLFETKLRKNECPNCRNSLTPISNPLAMVCQEIQPASFRDAVIHRSTTAREAVRRKLELQQQQRLQLQQSQMQAQSQ